MRLVIVFAILSLGLVTYIFYSQVSVNKLSQTESPNTQTDVVIEPSEFTPSELTLEKVFEDDASQFPDSSYSILFTGDVMLGRKVNANTLRYNDFFWPFEEVSEKLTDTDLTVVNLEGPFVYDCPTTTEGFKFCGDSRHSTGLSYAGVDIANLANNHSDNYGISGLNETKEILSRVNIETFNEDEPLTYELKDQSIVFLGYNVIFQESDPLIPKIQKDIMDAKTDSDLLIVSFHWGDEYTATPNKHQVNLAHAAIDTGADVIIGHHPHWVQTIEIYKNKLILYSLGNFVFDQMWSRETREGLAAKLIFDKDNLVDVELMPILIEDYGQPYFLEGELKSEMVNRIMTLSQSEGNKLDY